uniref:Ground-like domain-containing protein n=1 Tax=Onchocerca volvulus TaxID=6282 RepID=A0A8R1XZV1_ONCVO
MLWNIQKSILIIESFLHLFSYSVPCLCYGSLPSWHCFPNCFQGDRYRKYYSSSSNSNQFNRINLPRQQQQQQQYEEEKFWQPDLYNSNYEPTIYVSETTPYPYEEQLDTSKLISRQPQPVLVPVFHQYDADYLLEALNDLSNRTTSKQNLNFSPVATIDETSENVSVTKQKSFQPHILAGDHSYRLRRNYPAKAAFPSAVCNSRRLRKVMLRAITTDVSESKRSITEAAEYVYQGIKFDVICAQGDFSYVIHARKYCEVIKENITCFAFR